MKTINPMKVIYYINKNGKKVRYTDTFEEFVDMYVEEVKERYGQDTEVIVEDLR